MINIILQSRIKALFSSIQLKWMLKRVLFVFLIQGFLCAQNNIKNIEVNHHYGFLIPHHPYLKHLNKGHSQITEVSYKESLSGLKEWHSNYSNLTRGVSFVYLGLANKKVLGNGVALFSFFESPIINKKIKWNVKLGFGLSYLAKKFDRVTNNKNISIGSHINPIMYLNSTFQVPLSNRFSFFFGIFTNTFIKWSI